MNELEVKEVDEDGFIITDKEKDRCYIYFEEVDELIQKIRKIAYDNNIRRQHSVHSIEKPINENQIFKTCEIINKEQYSNYMKSDTWRKKRMIRMQYDAHRCIECGGTENLEVHHINYDNFGNEDIKYDLRTMCNKCHKKTTEINKRRRFVITDLD